MRRTGVRASRRTTSTRSPSIGRDRAHVSIRPTARSRWPCSAHFRSNIGDLAGMRTYSVSAGTIAASHVRWTNSPSFFPSMVMMPDGSIVAKEDGMKVPRQHYVYTTEQRRLAEASRDAYQPALVKAGHGRITTEILDAPEFYYAEEYHQQYLAKNPGGYCGLGGTGVLCPTGVLASAGDTR